MRSTWRRHDGHRRRAGRSRSPARSSRCSRCSPAAGGAVCTREPDRRRGVGPQLGRAPTARSTCTSPPCAPSSAARSWCRPCAASATGSASPTARHAGRGVARARAAAGDRAGRSSASLAVGLGGAAGAVPTAQAAPAAAVHRPADRHRSLFASLAAAAAHRRRDLPGSTRRARPLRRRCTASRCCVLDRGRNAGAPSSPAAPPALDAGGWDRVDAGAGQAAVRAAYPLLMPWDERPLVLAEPVLVDGEVRGAVGHRLAHRRAARAASCGRGRWSRAAVLLALALGVLVALPVVRWILRPVRRLDEGTGRVAAAVLAGRRGRARRPTTPGRRSCAGSPRRSTGWPRR